MWVAGLHKAIVLQQGVIGLLPIAYEHLCPLQAREHLCQLEFLLFIVHILQERLSALLPVACETLLSLQR